VNYPKRGRQTLNTSYYPTFMAKKPEKKEEKKEKKKGK